VFDRKILDHLIDEDKDLSLSRRYQWACGTLSELNDSISALIIAYEDTFVFDPWCGQHPSLWPENSALSETHLREMLDIKHDIDFSIDDLKKVRQDNEVLRREAEDLRKQLLLHTTIKRSLKRNEQARHMKFLVSASLLFLPLTFVTVGKPGSLSTSRDVD